MRNDTSKKYSHKLSNTEEDGREQKKPDIELEHCPKVE
jgi:hypothetical protein